MVTVTRWSHEQKKGNKGNILGWKQKPQSGHWQPEQRKWPTEEMEEVETGMAWLHMEFSREGGVKLNFADFLSLRD